ncbi:MAG: type II toxin-antitoxin system VapB family antitoxin [Myxococcota bacterium]
MRTTVDIRDDLLRRARRHAADTDRTLSELVDTALSELLDRPRAARSPPLPVARPSALAPGVDLSPRTLKEILAEDDPA